MTNEWPLEYGERPKEIPHASVWDALDDFLRQGPVSDYEVAKAFPTTYAKYGQAVRDRIKWARQEIINTYLPREVHYIWGPPRTGKTRFVLEEHGPQNVHRITDYKNPFDNYRGQPVILFEEFRSQLPINQMLALLDNYISELPARYNNQIGVYDTVYIVSNWPLDQQYKSAADIDLAPFHARITSETKLHNCT